MQNHSKNSKDKERGVSMRVFVNLKKLGKRKQSITRMPYELESSPLSVRDLITNMVTICVQDYNKRFNSNEISESLTLLKNLTLKEIDDKAESGKIGFGVNYGNKAPDPMQAIEQALTAFEDGIFRIFIGKGEVKELEEEIQLEEDQELTFVRMTMLSGRLW